MKNKSFKKQMKKLDQLPFDTIMRASKEEKLYAKLEQLKEDVCIFYFDQLAAWQKGLLYEPIVTDDTFVEVLMQRLVDVAKELDANKGEM